MKTAAAAVLGLGLLVAAQAATAERYFGGLGSYVFADSSRNADDGAGARLFAGIPLNDAVAIEVTAFGHQLDAETGSNRFEGIGGGLDLVVPAGGDRFRPFFLLGAGGLSESSQTTDDSGAYLNGGIGALIRLAPQWQLRAEGRYVNFFVDSGSESSYGDVHLGLGLQYRFAEPVVAPPPAPPPPPPPPAPKDSDGDKVVDGRDQCPNTPPGVQVDAAGCPLDQDGDRVPDYLDRCPNTPPGLGLKVDASGCVTEKQTVVLQNVNFEFNKDSLTVPAREALRTVAAGLRSQPSLVVEIAGHTDSAGSNAYNQGLSDRRARSVRNFLTAEGVPPAQLSSRGYGETQPVASNATDEGRAQNRRVEFRVLAK